MDIHMDAEHEEGKLNSSNPPPSSSSSPEFSFEISIHSPYKTDPPPSINAIDLSPADDIFFHGHLLPLHLLSQCSISPRSSANSLDNFPLPEEPNKNIHHETRERSKRKSFSLSELAGKWRKGRKVRDEEDDEEKKMKFSVGDVLKRYVRFFREKRGNLHLRRQPYSSLGKHGLGLGEYSAPASLRTSPRNSVLVATAPVSSSIRDGTVEELQAAIQAAIAHCKNS